MTRITSETPVRRETAAEYRGVPIVVELHAGYLVVSRKGHQDKAMIDYAAIYEVAWKMKAREDRERR